MGSSKVAAYDDLEPNSSGIGKFMTGVNAGKGADRGQPGDDRADKTRSGTSVGNTAYDKTPKGDPQPQTQTWDAQPWT